MNEVTNPSAFDVGINDRLPFGQLLMRQFAAAGLAVLVGLGGLFVSPEVLKTMPLAAKLLVQQPVISGGLTLVVLHSLLCRSASAPEAAQA